MADFDTAAKRLSGINIGCPWRGLLPIPDGDISSAGDRQTIAFLYSGIVPDVAANNGSGEVSGSGTLVGAGYRTSTGSGTVSGTGALIGASISTTPPHEGLANWKWDKRKKKPRVIRFSDYETREAVAAELAKAALPIVSVPVETPIDEWEEIEDTFIAFELMRLLH